MPDSDTAALLMLVSNTASTVSNTFKILEVAKKTSEKIDKYNFMAMRRYFIARRIQQHARDLIEAQKMKPKNLQQMNQVLIRLKMDLRGLKDSIDQIGRDVYHTENFVDTYWDRLEVAFRDEKEANAQEIISASEGTSAKHLQNTAMNTAFSSKMLAKMRRDQLAYQKLDLALKKDHAKNSLRKDQFYKDWIGLNRAKGIEGGYFE